MAFKSCWRKVSSRPFAGVLARFERNHVSILQAIVAEVLHLPVLVKMNGKNGTVFNARIEERNLFFHA